MEVILGVFVQVPLYNNSIKENRMKIKVSEIKELIKVYDIARTFLDVDGQQEAVECLEKRFYTKGDNGLGLKKIHEDLSRFVSGINFSSPAIDREKIGE